MAVEGEPTRRFMTTSDVARYCSVSNDGVLKWIKAGKLRAFATPGGHYRISAEDFRDFLDRFDIPIDESFFGGQQRACTVLVVDDEREMRELIRRMLERLDLDLRVEEASDGYEAGIKIGSLQPDLVILDVIMPRIDGVSLCRSIRGNARTRQIKVLAITALRDNVAKMFDAGADHCMVKPIAFESFKREASRLLSDAAPTRAARG
jgi:excisionase family DNA binding protein